MSGQRITPDPTGGNSPYAPEPDPTMQQRIEALPYLNATRSMDYGRGYTRAVRDVLELLWSHDRHWLTEPCGCDPEVVAGQIKATPLPTSTPSALPE